MYDRWRVVRGIGRASRAGRPRPAFRSAPGLDSLEGRELLSRLPRFSALGDATAVVAIHHRPHHDSVSTHNPLNERVVGGHVAKHPRFYSEYAGPRLASLNATGAIGELILGVGYRFTGRVAGPIDTSRSAEYVFGVDRGGARPPMTITPPTPGVTAGGGIPMNDGKSLVMFTRRPNIFVDALVTISVGPTGSSGQVRLMQKDGSPGPAMPIAPGDIQVSGNEVSAIIDPRLLPPNGFPADQYYYAFWARTGPGSGQAVASFAPEYNVTPIGLRRG